MFSGDVRKVPVPLAALCFGLAVLHGFAAAQIRAIHAPAPIMSPPPDATARKAMAFGDDQFLYRGFAVDLQNAGDGAGQVTPITRYNFDYVLGWLDGLQTLDPKSNHHFILAARYFSYSTNPANVRRLVGFLVAHAEANPQRHWFWLAQAVELADHKLGDTEYALNISLRLAAYDFPGMQSWMWYFPALLYEKLGRYNEGLTLIERVIAEKGSRLTIYEKNWLAEVTQRLKSELQ